MTPCPRCGLELEKPHDTHDDCLAALRRELERLRYHLYLADRVINGKPDY